MAPVSPEYLEQIVSEEFERAVPEAFLERISNVAFLVEDEPDEDVRREEGLGVGETLLGYYRGVPHTDRGDLYGVGMVLPDTITLYRLPLLEEAAHIMADGLEVDFDAALRRAVRETIWHEVAHHFGMDEGMVRHREHLRDHGTE